MPLKLRKGGVWQDVTGLRIFAGGAWRTIKAVQIYADGAWRKVAGFVSDLAATPSASARSVTGDAGPATTPSVTVTPSGGLAPYTYSWSVDNGAITATNPTSATTAFRGTIPSSGSTFGTATCTVTDGLGSTATANVSVTFKATVTIS